MQVHSRTRIEIERFKREPILLIGCRDLPRTKFVHIYRFQRVFILPVTEHINYNDIRLCNKDLLSICDNVFVDNINH